MSKLMLNARMTEILGSFFDDEEMMSIHLDSINILISMVLDSDDDDPRKVLDMVCFLHQLQEIFQAVRKELLAMGRVPCR
ncbi:MAG: hypothetical protein IJK08_04305 [Prevotella sp.]|nr:hypothetical protein [Prevotella sp.]